MLATADPKAKAELYAELGVQVHYDPHRRIVSVSAGSCTTEREMFTKGTEQPGRPVIVGSPTP